MTTIWQTVRVFISSTFRDMQAERDHLVRFVFPRLRQELLQRRIHLLDVDLRWGVTSEQDALSVCREVVDECRPRFLCMLGGRYGWVPPGKTRSITADEVHYGVLDRDLTSRGFAYFYFRDPSATAAMVEVAPGEFREPAGSHGADALAELKTAIIEAGLQPFIYQAQWDDPSRRLIGLKEFGDRVYADLKQSIDQEFGPAMGEKPGEFTEENAAMEAFIEERVQRFVLGSRQPVWNELLQHAEGTGGNGYLCLTGEAGSGKSALMGKFCQDYREAHPQDLVIPHFVGASPGSTDVRRTLRRLCHEMVTGAALTAEIPEDPEKLRVAFAEILQQASAKKRVVILLDAINQFDPTMQLAGWSWLPEELPATARIILSALSGPALESLRQRRQAPGEVKLNPLSVRSAARIVQAFLHRYGKQMDRKQRRALLSKADAGTPLYLLVALEELRTLGTYEEITDRIAQLPPDTRALFIWILKRLEDDDGFRDTSGQKIGRVLVSRFASLLGASRHGLSQKELVELLSPGDPQGNVAALAQLLRPYLMQRGELLDFYHGQFREAVGQEYLQTETQRHDVHAGLAAHFNHAERTATPWHGAPRRSLTEFPYHLWQSGASERIVELGRDESFLSAQQEGLNEEPDLPFCTLRMALDAACGAGNPMAMAEFTLAHAYRLVWQQAENPLDALLNQRLAPDVALRRAWGLADALEPQSRAYALLLLAWKLKALARLNEAGSSLKKLDERPLSDKGDYRALLVLLLAGLEPEFETSHWAAALMDDKGLKELATRLAGQHQFESAKRIALLDKTRRYRDEALRAIAVAQAQAGCYAEALATVARIEPFPQTQAFNHHHAALLEVAKAQTQAGLFAEATSTVARVYREWRAEASVAIAAAQVKFGQFAEAIATAAKLETAQLRASVLVDIGKEQARVGQDPESVFDEAASTAASIRDDKERFKALLKVAVGQAHAGRVDRAISTTARMATVWQRAEALGEIAVVQAQAGQDPRLTLRAALASGGPRYLLDNFPKVMCEIAKVQVVMGRLPDAISTTEVIQDAAWRAEALAAIATAQAKAGQDPRPTFSSAVSAAGQIDWAIRRAEALAAIGAAQAKAGLDPSSTFSCAVSAAGKVTDHERRVPAMIAIAEAQAYAGQDPSVTFAQAASAAAGITYAIQRAEALTAIAAAQAKAGQDPSLTFAQAVSMTAEIAQAEAREQALAAIAAAQAKAGQLTEMASTSARISDRRGINGRLLEISVEQARVGKFSEASSTAAEIDVPGVRIDAVREIAAAEAQAGRFAEATFTAEKIEYAGWRAEALVMIAAAQVKAAQDPNSTLLQAASAAAGIEQRKSRAEALVAVADAQAKVGQDPSLTLAKAISPSTKSNHPEHRAEAFCEVAVAIGQIGADSKSVFVEAVSAAMEIEDAWYRDKPLNMIVEAQTQVGQYSAAISTAARMATGRSYAMIHVAKAQAEVGRFAEATSTAMRSEGAERTKALGAIGVAQARAGQDPRPTFAQAISALTRENYHPEGRANIMRMVAVDQARAGLFSEAISTAIGIEYANKRAGALCEIGMLEAQAGQDPHPTFALSEREAATISDPLSRACTMCFLGDSMARASVNPDWAFAEAVSAAARTEDGVTRAGLLFDIAEAQAKAGRFADATSTAATIEKAHQRASALCEISDAQAKAGRFSDAASTTASIKDTGVHASALRKIAVAQAKAGQNSEAAFAEALTAAELAYTQGDRKLLRETVEAQVQAGRFADATLTAAKLEYADWRADVLREIAVAQAQVGLDCDATFIEAISAAAEIDKEDDRGKALSQIAAARARLGELTGAMATADMILVEQTHGINEVGSAMAKLPDRSKARAALNAYLPRAARYAECAWHSCGVVAHLYPDRAIELANYLIAFSCK